jgi:Replication protein
LKVADALEAAGYVSESRRLWSCGRWYKLGRCPNGGHRLEPHPCNSLLCADCAVRKSRSLRKRILSRCRRRGKRYWFLTLTVPNTPSLLRGQLDRLIACFAQLRRSSVWNSVKKEKEKWVGVTGGVYSLESTYASESSGWHPHIHALIEMPKGHPPEWLAALKAEWLRVTGDARNLHLTPVYGKSKSGKKLYRRVNLRALKELVKYVTKSADFSDQPERVVEFYEAFRNVRRVQAFGSFVGALKEAEREPGDEQGLLNCSCGGQHLHGEFVWQRALVHISQTVELPDGSRQLAFDFVREMQERPSDESPPWMLTPPQPARVDQWRIEFAGALPAEVVEQPRLFEEVA